jgi:4-hydroxybenzoate polyprenyltransferase
MPVIKLMRPTQWIKNGFVFMPLIFSGRLLMLDDVIKVVGMCLAFCLASSATYIFNDYMDMEQDRAHPRKKNRPLASGAISPVAALFAMFLLIIGIFVLAVAMKTPPRGFIFLGIYLILQVIYSAKLKDVVLVDVLTISVGFLLRVLGGAVVIGVTVSSWLVLCTFSVAILLALGKRRHEVVILCEGASCHRPVLENYSVSLLDQLLQVVTTSTFIFYCLYSVRGNPTGGIHAETMMYTIPLVTYGIFRYMYLIYQLEDGGSPTVMLLTDPPLLICAILWLAACIAVIYL